VRRGIDWKKGARGQARPAIQNTNLKKFPGKGGGLLPKREKENLKNKKDEGVLIDLQYKRLN